MTNARTRTIYSSHNLWFFKKFEAIVWAWWTHLKKAFRESKNWRDSFCYDHYWGVDFILTSCPRVYKMQAAGENAWKSRDTTKEEDKIKEIRQRGEPRNHKTHRKGWTQHFEIHARCLFAFHRISFLRIAVRDSSVEIDQPSLFHSEPGHPVTWAVTWWATAAFCCRATKSGWYLDI